MRALRSRAENEFSLMALIPPSTVDAASDARDDAPWASSTAALTAIPPTVFAAPAIVLPASDDAICSPALDIPSATEHMALPMASDAEVAVSTITFPAPSAAFVAPLAADSMAADASFAISPAAWAAWDRAFPRLSFTGNLFS